MRTVIILLSLTFFVGCDDQASKPADKMTFEELLQAAPRGTPEQQFRLGVAYNEGMGVTENTFNASIWFRRAAMHGHTEAMFQLAGCYDDTDLPPNHQETMLWLRRAADAGHVKAMDFLGDRLAQEGTPGSMQEAVKYWSKAAELGYPESIYSLAKHQLWNKSFNEGMKLLQQCALLGHADAAMLYGILRNNPQAPKEQRIEGLAWIHVAIAAGADEPGLLAERLKELTPEETEAMRKQITAISASIKKSAL